MRILLQSFLILNLLGLLTFAQKAPDYKLINSFGLHSFIFDLNENGKSGFRLAKLSRSPIISDAQTYRDINFIATLERNGQETFEYDWFEAYSSSELQFEMDKRARDGYRFKEVIPFSANLCDGPFNTPNSDKLDWDASDTERVTARAADELNKLRAIKAIRYGALFIVERKKDAAGEKQYKVVTGFFGRKQKADETLNKELDTIIPNGYRPVMMTPFVVKNDLSISVLLESDDTGANVDHEVILTEFGFEKKVNDIAKTGYSLLSAGDIGAKKYALLAKDSTTPNTHKWIKTDNKNLTSDLDRSTFHLAAYGMQGCDFVTKYLVLSDPAEGSHKRETKLFQLSDDSELTFPERLQSIELSDESLRNFTEYVDRGFDVTDIYYSNGFKLILERY